MDKNNLSAETIFDQAIAIESPQDRAAFLEQVCQDDAQLLGTIKKLVEDHFRAGNFLERPAMDPQQTSAFLPVGETVGTQVGPYKLLQQIGEGGMGVVYTAEQQKPIRRRVALKIIKPGMDSRQVIARFEAERQALAMMDHPNIARVLDAGCTDSGLPYFAMELIQGIPITQYCDDKQLNTGERLELFIHVCRAVQHAHQKGIIHRDIKPSNVLVMIYDGKPIPKIIDFGVAKALHQQLTEKTLFTQFGAVVGTLEYMSPEQAEMDVLGTDTRTDVYSLGVLLYELLTGTTPLDAKKLRSLGYAEMLKTIREVDPPKPSTRLSQSAHDVANISAKRHTEPRRLQKLIAGDLDWIVMKCLEKDRTRRYETANGLAMDIQRHLHDEAVTACPPGQLYKLQKMVRRNKLACTAAACVMLALVVGLAASLWQAGRAAREAARAQQEANRASEALVDLQAAAPSIAAEARALAVQEKFDEAIGKLDYAAKLRPDVPEYLLAKADLLETQLRLADAAAVYRAALKLKPDDARAKENAELCEQLSAAPKSPESKLTGQSLARLNAQMAKDQRPAAEMMPIARLLGDEKQYIVKYWLDRLKGLPNRTDTPLEQRLTVREDGLLDLNLDETQISDLSPLVGMPLGGLNVRGCQKVTDLSPVRAMHLTWLNVDRTGVRSLEPLRAMTSLKELYTSDTKVSDLSPLSGLRLHQLGIDGDLVTSLAPLRGMPLTHLGIRSIGVTDLSPLVGMPLKNLDASFDVVTDFTPLAGLPLETCLLQGVHVGDLAFLRGLPLKQLVLTGAQNARNLAVLSELRTLEALVLPDETFSSLSVEDCSAIEKLRDHPSLKQLAVAIPIYWWSLANVPSKDEFWKNWDRDYAWVMRVRKAGFAFDIEQGPNGSYYVKVHDPKFTDCSIFTGSKVRRLDLDQSQVTDLSPLADLPLTALSLRETPVNDLSPLRSPTLRDALRELRLWRTKVTDFSPVAGCAKLELFDAADTALSDLSFVKGMKLRTLLIERTPVADLAPVAGMPLTRLDIGGTHVTDLSPLLKCPTLAAVVLPRDASDIESLRALPNLANLSYSSLPGGDPDKTAKAFWAEYDRTKGAAAP